MKQPKLFAALLCLAVPAFLSPAVAEEVQIGYVNFDRILREAPAAIKAGKKLEGEFSQRDHELKRLAADLKSRQDALAKDGVTLSEPQLRSREREVNEISREFQRRQQAFQEDLNLRQREESTALIEKANEAIKQIADADRLDLVLQDAVWAGNSLDITGKVIDILSGDNKR